MKNIVMIKGGYGLSDKNGRVHLKTPDDEPFDAPDGDAKFLVNNGYAEYSKKTKKKAEAKKFEEKADEPEQIETPSDDPQTDYQSMKMDDLKKIADNLGVEYNSRTSKADLIELIESADEVPSFEPQEVEA